RESKTSPLTSVAPRFLLERHAAGTAFKGFEMFRILLVILLVVTFGRIKFHRWQDLGHDRLMKFSRAREFCLRRFGDFLLVIVSVKNRGTVTGADICKLAVGLSGIDLSPINVEQLFV